MRKYVILLFGLLLLGMMFVSAGIEAPKIGTFGVDSGDGNVNTAEADAIALQETIDKVIPVDESGNIDYEGYQPYVTKAKERIDSINLWLNNSVGWMRYIFHMKPAISLLFFINVYIILWFFVVFVLNAGGIWFFIEEEKKSRIFGGVVFVLFMVVKLYYGLANLLYTWWLYFWNVFVDSIILIIFAIGLLALFGWAGFAFVRTITASLSAYKAKKKAWKQNVDIATSIESVDKLVEQIGKRR